MVLDRSSGDVRHLRFRDLPDLLKEDDCLVINRTSVLPAKFSARRQTGGRLDGLFIEERAPGRWTVLLSGVGRLVEGERLDLGHESWSMIFLRRLDRGACEVRIQPADAAHTVLEAIGEAPLPPYIRRSKDEPPDLRLRDRDDYQTVFATTPGAIAAPTAGMHFTPELLDRIQHGTGTTIADLVLHVGRGTFQPVEVDRLADHPMHSEWFSLPPESAASIRKTRADAGRIVAVGTTSVRVLETCSRSGALNPSTGWTDLMIYPPFEFQATDALLTNFHLPGSTLLALVFAFAGRQTVLNAYRCAIDEGYRFYSYGDAILIL